MWEFFIETAAISININIVQNQIKTYGCHEGSEI